MKQIYFTICEDGKSFSGRSGYVARAVSAGIYQPDQFEGYAFYANPDEKLRHKGVTEDHFIEAAPVSLRYCVTKSGSPIVVHSVYAKGKRPGNYFSHLLADLPPGFSPADAIALWESPLWQKHDAPSISSQLPDIDWSDRDTTMINEKAFGDFLREDKNANLFRFLLHAWLHRTPDRKIVLVADPDKIIFALWGVFRCVPKSMWENMSFSTYENTSCNCTYDITGFWNPDLIESEVKVLEQIRQGRGNADLWSPSSESGNTVIIPQRKWEQHMVDMCCCGDFEQIDTLWADFPDGFGKSLEQLEIYLLASNTPSGLTESQLAEGLKNRGIRDIAERSLKSDEALCKTIAEEWFTRNSDTTSRLELLLDELHDESLLDNLVLSRLHSEEIAFIKKVLRQPPSQKFKDRFQTEIWQILNPEKLDRENIKFFRPHALDWFNAHKDQQGIEIWSAIHSIEELSEELPQQDTPNAINMCCRFCFSKNIFNQEKTYKLAKFLVDHRPTLAVKTAMQLCTQDDCTKGVLETFFDSVVQNKDIADHFVKLLVPEVRDVFSRYKSKPPQNYVFCLDKIVQAQTLNPYIQLQFSDLFSEEQSDMLAENWMRRYGIDSIREHDPIRNFICDRLDKNIQQQNKNVKKQGLLSCFFGHNLRVNNK